MPDPKRRLVVAVAGLAGAAALLSAGAVAPGAARSAQPTFTAGSGAASGSIARARLFYGGLSLPLGVGTTSASYTNSQAKALAVPLDVGAYVGLVGETPAQFKPVVVDSNEGDKNVQQDVGAGESVGRAVLHAGRGPASSSEVHMADLDLPALVRVEGAHTRSASDVFESRQRRASSIVEIGRVSIAGGLVVLGNLRWEATQRTGFEPIAAAAFAIGSATIAGVPVPVQGADLDSGLASINGALAPVGLKLSAPAPQQVTDGAVAMGPLRVGLADSQVGAELLGPIVASARPLLAPAFDAMTDANSSLGLVGLVADIGLGVVDGSGGVEVSLGGATATTSATGFIPAGTTAVPGQPVIAPAAAPAVTDVAPAARTADGPDVAPDTGGFADVSAPSESAMGPQQFTNTGALRCALEAAPRRNGGCRNWNLPAAVGISALACAAVALAEVHVRRRRELVVAAA